MLRNLICFSHIKIPSTSHQLIIYYLDSNFPLRCSVKFGTLSAVTKKNAFQQIFIKLFKLILHYFIRILLKFEWIPSFLFDFIRDQSLTSHDLYTRRFWAVATFSEVLLLYISKRKRTIPFILQSQIPLTLLDDVLVFYQKL